MKRKNEFIFIGLPVVVFINYLYNAEEGAMSFGSFLQIGHLRIIYYLAWGLILIDLISYTYSLFKTIKSHK
jgi:hypothetical protein